MNTPALVSTIVIYHEVAPGIPCPDGLAAAWVASKALGQCDIVGRVYNDDRPLPTIKEGDRVYLVDFSLPAQQLESWADAGAEVTVLDHHKTALENLSGLSDRITQGFDMAECGATMAWSRFFPGKPLPEFLRYIKDRDLWNHKLPNTAEVHAAYKEIGRSFELYDRLAQMGQQEFLDYMVPIGKPAVEERRAKVAAIAARQELADVAGYQNIPVVMLADDGSEDWLTSDICQSMYLAHPSALFTACWVPSSHSWSLRSNKDGNNTDVGAIAKSNGGGGHRNAAGFKATKANA